MTPVFIIGGITTGFFTATEASVIASLYAAALGFAYRDLKLRDLPPILFVSLKQTCGLMFIMATANFFGWFTIFQRIPDELILQLTAMGTSQSDFLWIVIGVVLALGCFLDGNAIFLITLPIFMKICPLFGVAVESFAKVGIWNLALECMPYLVTILIVTIVCAFVPGIALWLPNLMMGAIP
jgi:TRAP-type C4-dicarboxylate transport system permease large subunit